MQNERLQKTIDSLNPAQKEAATTLEGPLLVIAGAGSGKTSVLTARIALLVENGVAPERILALTFTKKAAEEMRSRIIGLVGENGKRICMGTFHSIFIRFLRPYAQRLFFPQNFTILDEDDSISMLKRSIATVLNKDRVPEDKRTQWEIKRYKEEDKNYSPKLVKSIISSCKNDLITADIYAKDEQRTQSDGFMQRPKLKDIFREYRDECLRAGVMDFDDILLHTDILLANYPDILALISGSFDYILVDEYQDTNYAQYSILQRLTVQNRNICVVGDDSQSIYAFRGARIENIMNFREDYPEGKLVKLEKNYRSTKNIVLAANNLIGNNSKRIPKVCVSDNGDGEPIILRTEGNEKEEARHIAETIAAAVRDEGKNYDDFAILYRTNSQSRVLEDELVRSRIPYMIYSGTSFFQRMEVKDLMAYFRLTVNPHDDEAFIRVVNKPARGFGEAAMRTLTGAAQAWGMPLWLAATNPSAMLLGFNAKASEGLSGFISLIESFRDYAGTHSAYETACFISDQVGFYEEYNNDKDEESQKRADNIRELLDSVKSYEEDIENRNADLTEDNAEKPTLVGYLQNAMLLTNADTGGDSAGKVSLMTVHCAKGLEFDTVFVTGMERGLFPLEIEKTSNEKEEERRLFYVAITRAKKQLYISRAEYRMRFGTRKFAYPSCFLSEIQ